MDHRSGRLDENLGGQFSQVDHRARRLDRSSRGYPDQTDHRPTGLDRSPLGFFGQQDQQDRSKLNSNFSSHVGSNWEISVDSQAIVQDCDSYLFFSSFSSMNQHNWLSFDQKSAVLLFLKSKTRRKVCHRHSHGNGNLAKLFLDCLPNV